ncbi:hypothetical protein NQK81_34845 [Amycolatopsis roodepoortensis]|uniref:Uncharacterized protein n=1 Tax=Amycolatopsis roodepoortensis TaxID=700274 RepID=A0ABR9L4J3_9PSEU|nr:hypothetical protein [Amycolatopsis roodepoortensis]MBE1575445.1 hypothetical protein [Amycolatopsis roodepoortensis]UUV29902.1 hypothetical protein NQK81_34845 [Amycolatopsis roodepoortensis]
MTSVGSSFSTSGSAEGHSISSSFRCRLTLATIAKADQYGCPRNRWIRRRLLIWLTMSQIRQTVTAAALTDQNIDMAASWTAFA